MKDSWIEKLTKEDIEEIAKIWVYEMEESEWELDSWELQKEDGIIELNIKTKTLSDNDEGVYTIMENEDKYILSDFGVSLFETEIDDPTETYNERLIAYREFMLDKFGNEYALDYLFDLTDSSFSYEHTSI